LRRRPRPKLVCGTKERIGGRRKLHIEELYNLYYS